MKNCIVILAGGQGQRLWPLSTCDNPKPFVKMPHSRFTFIEETVKRALNIVSREDIFIITTLDYKNKVLKTIGHLINESNIISEPTSRNTGPCVGYATAVLKKKYGNCNIAFFPSDHYIENEKEFVDVLKKTFANLKEMNKVVLLGMSTTSHNTNYGYIKIDSKEQVFFKRVYDFKEKPNAYIAKKYNKDSNYFWNIGILITSSQTIVEMFEKYNNKICSSINRIYIYLGTDNERAIVSEEYEKMEKISVDCAILEYAAKNDEVVCVVGEFGWRDNGTWLELSKCLNKTNNDNLTTNKLMAVDTKNSIFYTENQTVLSIGVSDLMVISIDGILVICDKNRIEEIGNSKYKIEKYKKTVR